jgi:hypothetical protein
MAIFISEVPVVMTISWLRRRFLEICQHGNETFKSISNVSFGHTAKDRSFCMLPPAFVLQWTLDVRRDVREGMSPIFYPLVETLTDLLPPC